MAKWIIYCLSITIPFTLLISCEKSSDCPSIDGQMISATPINFNDSELAKIPYRKIDTIKFKLNDSVDVKFVLKGIDTTFDPEPSNNTGSCYLINLKFGKVNYKYVSDSSNKLILSFYLKPVNNKYDRNTGLTINYWGTSVIVNDAFSSEGSGSPNITSMVVRNVTYYKVFQITNYIYDNTNSMYYSDYIYYSLNDGIIKIKDYKNNHWDLMK